MRPTKVFTDHIGGLIPGPDNVNLIIRDNATKYITITVAEYHFLTKAAAMLEVIVNDPAYDHTNAVNAVKAAVEEMKRTTEAGGEE